MTTEYSIQPSPPQRPLWKFLLLLLAVLAAGYASRRFSHHLPSPIRKRSGDALWASAVFVLVAIIRPRWTTAKVAVVALLISYCVEFSQIYHRPWIDYLRSFTLGKLILGTTFFWLDQVAYTVGVAMIVPFDLLLRLRIKSSTSPHQPQT